MPSRSTCASRRHRSRPCAARRCLGLQRRPRLAEENELGPFTKGSGIYVHSVTRGTIWCNYFQPADIIRSVNGKATKTIDDLQGVLAKGGRSWELEVERNGRTIKGTVRT